MATGNFGPCNAFTRAREGGDVNDPHDPGGLTSRGVTAAAGAAFRKRLGLAPKVVTAWSEAEVSTFYRAGYWNAMSCEQLPFGVDLAVYDAGVNSGVGRSLGWLRAVGAFLDPIPTIKALCAKRSSFLHSLANWKRYGKGWGARVAMVEASGVAMYLKATKGASEARSDLLAEADDAHRDGVSMGKGAVASGSAGAGSPFVLPTDTLGVWIVAAVVVAGLAVAAWLVVKLLQHNARAEAYKAAAAGVRQ